MGRSGYSYDLDTWDLIRWRGAVRSAIRGKRGQQMLRDLRDALDALPKKALIANDLITPDGDCCAMGALGLARGIDMDAIDPYDPEEVSQTFGIARALAKEIAEENDYWTKETPEERWSRMREWVESQIRPQAD